MLRDTSHTQPQPAVSTEPCGDSAWSMSTARIVTRNADGTVHQYFVKIVEGDLASERVLCEYSCVLEFNKTMPSVVPKPHVFGPFLDSDGYFFLCDYLSIDHRGPDPGKLTQRISELPRDCIRRQAPLTGRKEFHDAMRITLENVIPRLSGPIEQDGRSVKPCLIYGDLWEKNIGNHSLTEEIYIFDSWAYYAHHEMALSM
ncbi:hypothetical protein CHU98_g7452 [Xylaria longipes]|nr:hypothetical protein CHU98_g7452 [Xylaria longipes]